MFANCLSAVPLPHPLRFDDEMIEDVIFGPGFCAKIFHMAQQIDNELFRWNLWVTDLECRVAEQKNRTLAGANILGSLEVLHFMEQTLDDWRAHKRALEQRHC